MENILFKLMDTQGIWASLSIALIFYIIRKQDTRDKKQEMRESNYQIIIKDLTQKFALLNEIKSEIHSLRLNVSKKKS